MKNTKFDIVSFNMRLADVIKKECFMNGNILRHSLNECNQNNKNLSKYLLDNALITSQNLEYAMHILTGKLPSKGNHLFSSKYEIISKLGEGGMGVVYKVKDPHTQKILVLKTLQQEAYTDENIKRFAKEAEAVSQLQHPNIIPLHEFNNENNRPYFTMKYVDGLSLEQMIRDKKGTLALYIEVLKKIALALDYAHQRKIIHRDIKPGNILLDKNNEPYLTDFGLVKWVDKQSSLTQEGAVMGTLSYLSPEQARGQKSIDHRTDIYSLGMILYEILTDTLPFEHERFAYMFKQILRDIPQEPSKINPKAPKVLSAICMKAISKKVQDRQKTAVVFAQSLNRYQNNEKNLSTGQWVSTTKRWFVRRQIWILSICCLLCTGTLFSVVFKHLENTAKKKANSREKKAQEIQEIVKDSEIFDVKSKEGKELFIANRFKQAEKILKIANKIRPNDLEINEQLAKCYLFIGGYDVSVKKTVVTNFSKEKKATLVEKKYFKKAIYHLNKCIETKPWEDSYYEMKGIAHFKLSELQLAIYDFLRCAELNKHKSYLAQNICQVANTDIPVFLRFLLRHMFSGNLFSSYLEIDIDLFGNDKEELSKKIMAEKISQKASKINVSQWFNSYLLAEDSKVKKMTFQRLITAHYIEIEKHLQERFKKHRSERKNLEKLRNTLRSHHKKRLRKSIAMYFMSHDKTSFVQLEKNRNVDLLFLKKMMLDNAENDILRYYIAKILWQLGENTFFEGLIKGESKKTNYLSRLIAKIILREHSEYYRENLKILYSEVKKATPFLKVRVIEVMKNPDKLIKNITDDAATTTRVKLYAVAKMWPRNIDKSNLDYLFKMAISKKDDITKAFAMNVLFRENVNYKSNLFRQEKMEKQLLLDMDSEHFLVKEVAVCHAHKINFHKYQIKYVENLKSPDFLTKIQSIAALCANDDKVVKKIMLDKEESTFMRISPFIYMGSSFVKKKPTRLKSLPIGIIEKIFSGENELIKFLVVYHIYSDKSKGSFLIKGYIKKFIGENFYGKLAICLSLDSQTNTKKMVRKWLDDSSIYIGEVAAVSTAYNEMRLETRKPQDVYLQFKDKKPRIRKAAALGCVYKLYSNFYLPRILESSINEEDNDSYEEYFYKIEKLFVKVSQYNKKYIKEKINAFPPYKEKDESNQSINDWRDKLKEIKMKKQVEKCTFLAEKIYSSDKTKLEKAVVLFLLGRKDESLSLLANIEKSSPTAKYWHAKVCFQVGGDMIEIAKNLVREAINERPWSLKFRDLQKKINAKK